MAQSLGIVPYVGEAGGLRDWDVSADVTEIRSIEMWSWRPVAPTLPESPADHYLGAARRITAVLTAWRAAELRLQDQLEESPVRTQVRSDIAKLRAEYQRLFAKARR